MQTAIQETLQNRGTPYDKDSFDRVLALAGNEDMQVRWRYFLKTLKNAELPFADVIGGIQQFLSPVWDAIIAEKEVLSTWDAEANTWE